MNGNHSRVEWDRVSGSPPDEAAAFPFPRLVCQDVLGRVVDVVAVVTALAPVQLDHVLAENLFGREAQ